MSHLVDSRRLEKSYLESVPTSHYGGKAVVQQMGIITLVIITVLPESANNLPFPGELRTVKMPQLRPFVTIELTGVTFRIVRC